jgi:hypothetical protein
VSAWSLKLITAGTIILYAHLGDLITSPTVISVTGVIAFARSAITILMIRLCVVPHGLGLRTFASANMNPFIRFPRA